MVRSPVSKYITLLNLYLAQSIPMSFFSTVLPVIMRTERYSLTSIGYIQLIKLPWILKFFWAPIVDKTSNYLTQYKKWIIFSELFYAMGILGIGFLNIHTDFNTIIVLMVIAFTASATQDIATDAFAILILRKRERSMGNSMQSAGSFLGTLTGSGILLVIFYYFGWTYLLIALAGFVLLALVPLSLFRDSKGALEKPGFPPVKITDIVRFFRQKGILRRIVLLSIYYTGIIGILTMSKPWLVDLGYNIKEIGVMSGIIGASAGAVMAFTAGFIIRKTGKKNSMLLFAVIGLLTALYFLFLLQAVPGKTAVITGIVLLWGIYGMSSVIIYTIAMDIVRPGREGTDFTIQIVITHLSSLLVAVASGKFAHLFSYHGLFFAESVIALFIVLAVPFLYHESELFTEPITYPS